MSQTSNITSGFIDLTTQGDPEKYLYGMKPNVVEAPKEQPVASSCIIS